jgi:hypothetical protein
MIREASSSSSSNSSRCRRSPPPQQQQQQQHSGYKGYGARGAPSESGAQCTKHWWTGEFRSAEAASSWHLEARSTPAARGVRLRQAARQAAPLSIPSRA